MTDNKHDTLSNTNEPSAAALIQAQGQQMEHIDAIEWLRQMDIELKKDILSQIKPNIIL